LNLSSHHFLPEEQVKMVVVDGSPIDPINVSLEGYANWYVAERNVCNVTAMKCIHIFYP
jgi:hypothetical protein